MNNIFIKNLTALHQKNPDLVKKLQSYIPTELPQLTQENGIYNILYKGKFVHNQQNPLGEAQEIFMSSKNEPVSIHLIYGLGLGYLFQYTSTNSQGSVILFEPDLNIMWLAFTLVDFSKDILKNNVYITSTFEEVSQALYQNSGIKNFPQMLSLVSQRQFNPEEFETLVKKLQDLIGSFKLDLKYTREKFYPSLKMLLNNIPNLLKETPLNNFKNFYDNKTAVIVSAGPTLDKNIEILKKYRNNYILFTVGTAVKTLYAHGIKPDFLCIIETYDSSKQIQNLDLSDVYLITEPYSNPKLRDFNYKNIFSHISANSPVNHFWQDITGENIEEYWSKGTVSYTAINSARILGCSKIILVGQDLAYIEGQCYSKDSAYKDLICTKTPEGKWEICAKNLEDFANAISNSEDKEQRLCAAKNRLKNLNSALYLVKGISGEMIPTESVYATFVKPLSDFAKHFNNIEYINTSLVGAQIDGFLNLPLEEALKSSTAITIDEIKEKHNYNNDSIKLGLKEKLSELKFAISKIDEGVRFIKLLNKEMKRNNSVSVEVLKLLKNISVNYLYLSSDFSNKSKLFDYITSAEKIDLDYEMKMTKEFTTDSVSNIVEKISYYYEKSLLRIYEIEKIINNILEQI